ncbi:STN domain-containing protein [Caulobacter soli]|uniref:STN domain-containing protein n=1 Tax=Caulobacter soli TaxID=2708539 RepID=UPI0013EA52C7|nr:STN domain-containing protein [Caulobacter soli]
MLLAFDAGAKAVDSDRPVSSNVARLFNIPSQPLRPALEAYSVVTGAQLIYDSRLAEGRRSQRVVGVFKPETALRMLLEGSDLTVRYTGPLDITLVPIERSADAPEAFAERPSSERSGALALDTLYVEVAPGSEDRPDFSRYGHAVRQALKEALARNSATSDRIYQVQFDLWINERCWRAATFASCRFRCRPPGI